MLYYPVARNWTSRALPHLGNRRLNRILVRDFNRYTWGRWGKRFLPGMFPEEFDCGDWRCLHRGKPPRFCAMSRIMPVSGSSISTSTSPS